MGLLYFEVEADYQELIDLRKELAKVEGEMQRLGNVGSTALAPFEKRIQEITIRMEELTAKASNSAMQMQAVFKQMGSVQSGVANGSKAAVQNINKTSASIKNTAEQADMSFNALQDTLGGVNAGLGTVMKTLGGVGTMVGTAFGVGAIATFINKVQEVRTYFQDIESSMRVFLGDAEKANAFTAELKSYAYYNMFDFSQLADSAKQLIAYGNDATKISGKGGIIDQLSNIAAGTGASLGELVALYNKAKSTGEVMSRDIQSWAAKGVVLRDELKAMGQEASSGAISFYQLNEVLEKVTGTGGQFNNLMQEQLDNLSAAKGQLQDNMDAMYDEIGQRMEPLLKGAIDMASWLVDNYEVVGKTIITLASTYGVYRTTLGIMNALDRQRVAALNKALAVEGEEVVTTDSVVSAKKKEVEERRRNIQAIHDEMKAKEAEMMADKLNLEFDRDQAQKALDLTRKALSSKDTEYKALTAEKTNLQAVGASKAQLNAVQRKIEQNKTYYVDLLEKEKGQINALEQAELRLAANRTRLEGVTQSVTTTEKQLLAIDTALNADTAKSITLTNMLANAKANLAAKMAPLKAVLTNPYVLAAAAVAGLIFAIYKMSTAISDTEKGYNKAKDALEAYNKTIEERTEKGNDLISTLKDETKTVLEQETAYKRLVALYPKLKEFTKEQLKEMDTQKLIKDIQNNTDLERGEYLQRQIEEAQRQVKEVQANIDMGGGGWDKKQQLEGQIRAYQEEFKNYQLAIRQARMSTDNMTHEQRLAQLQAEQEYADKRVEITKNLHDKLKDYDADNAQAREEAVDAVTNAYNEVKAQVDALEKEDPILFAPQLEEAQNLLTELDNVRKIMQDNLDANPLEFTFAGLDMEAIFADVASDLDAKAGKVRREGRRFQKKLDELLAQSKNAQSDEELKGIFTQIESLYESTETNLRAYADATNNEKAKAAITSLIEDLEKDRTQRKSTFMNGGLEGKIADVLLDAQSGKNKAAAAITQENKEYTNLPKRIQEAKNDYEKLLAEYNETYRRYKSGEDVNIKDMEVLQKRVESAKKGYETLLTEDRRYYEQRKQLYEDEKRTRRQNEDIINSIEEYRIKQMRDGAEKSIAEARLAYNKQMQAVQRGEEDLRDQRAKEAKATAEKMVGAAKGEFDELAYAQNYVLSTEEANKFQGERQAATMDFIRKLDSLTTSSQTKAQKREEERYKAFQDVRAIEQSIAEIEAQMNENQTEEGQRILENMRERLELAKQIAKNLEIDESQLQLYKEYGTARQKKMAIDQDYQRQIETARANGESPYEIKRLEYKRDDEKAKIDLDELKSQVDWAGAIGAFGGIMADYSKKMYEKAKKLIDSPDFNKLSAEEQESILNMFDQIKENIVEKMDFGSLSDKISAYDTALENYNKVYEEQMAIIEDETASEQAKIIAEQKLADAAAELTQAQHDASYAIGKSAGAINAITAGLERIASGSLSQAYEGFQAIAEVLGKTPSKWGQIISAILKLIDLLADKGIGPIINGLLKAIEKVFDSLVDEITSGKFFEEVLDGTMKILAAILRGVGKAMINFFTNPLALGGYGEERGRDDIKKRMSKLFDETFYGGEESFAKLSEESAKLSDAFEVARERLLEDWDKKSAKEAVKDAEKVVSTYKEEIENYRKLGEQWGKTGASLFSHSNNFNWWNSLNNDAKDYFDSIGVSGVSSLMSLTPDQYKDLQLHSSVWSQIDDQLKEYIEQIIRADDEAEKTAKDIDAKFAGITFDDFADNFLSKLMDMDSTAYDVANDISDYFYQSMVTDLFNKDYRKKLKAVYDKLKDAREKGDKEALEAAKREEQQIAREFVTERNDLAEDFGITADNRQQQRAAGNFSTMTQEMGSELNGRFTAVQIAAEAIRGEVTKNSEILPALNTKVETLLGLIGGDSANPISNMISGIQNTLAQSYLELTAIRENTGGMLDLWAERGYLRNVLDNIKKNTDKLNKTQL